MAELATSIALRTDFGLLIDGKLEQSDEHLDVINPALGEVFARCPAATRAHLDRAVAAARAAFPAWRDKSFVERAALIKKMSQRLREKQRELAELLTREQGKPLAQSVAEIDRGAAQSDGMVGIEIPVEVLADDKDKHIELRYRPLGVVGIITPWNAPVNLALGPLVSALYTGNTVILKPSPYTPLSTLKLGELLREVFPAGVVNVLAGGDALGAWITEHAKVDKISFTGSVATGKKVLASAAATLKRVTLELGGNDPAIVMDDVDPKAVAKKIFFASFVNSGQVCMAIKRIYAHEKIYAPLCDALVAEAKKAKVGDGLDPATELGPIQNKMQYEKVKEYLEDARKNGKIIAGGELPDRPGYFIPPTIVRDIPDDARLVREEQFGPVLPILSYTDVNDAIARANDSEYGLGGTVWTKDLDRGYEVASQVLSGTIWVNKHLDLPFDVPFGGAKQSGIGVEFAEEGLAEFTQLQIINAPPAA